VSGGAIVTPAPKAHVELPPHPEEDIDRLPLDLEVADDDGDDDEDGDEAGGDDDDEPDPNALL
jgi:hypothetical protein